MVFLRYTNDHLLYSSNYSDRDYCDSYDGHLMKIAELNMIEQHFPNYDNMDEPYIKNCISYLVLVENISNMERFILEGRKFFKNQPYVFSIRSLNSTYFEIHEVQFYSNSKRLISTFDLSSKSIVS